MSDLSFLSLHIELPAPASFVVMESYLTTRAHEWTAKLPKNPPLWINRGDGFFLDFEEDDKPPLTYVGHLATPGNGVVVDSCECTNLEHPVAVKSMKTFSRLETIEKMNNEVKILRVMNHYHSIRAIGSYTHNDSLGIITQPVAACDLQEYLFEESTRTRKMVAKHGARPEYLPRQMGCLAYGLKYIHEQKIQSSSDYSSDDGRIRHRDIKPSNILLDGKRVLFADYGLSKFYTDTKTGTSGSSLKTPMYTSPERAANTHRNTACDIFSLGCVYADIFTVIKGRSAEDFRKYRIDADRDGNGYFYKTVPQVITWLEDLADADERCDVQIIRLIRSMLRQNYKDRPKAWQVWKDLTTYTSKSGVYFCGPCCMPLHRHDPLLHADSDRDPSQTEYAVEESPQATEPVPEDLSFKTKYELHQGPNLTWKRNLRYWEHATLDVVKGQSPHSQARKRIFLPEDSKPSARAINEAEILRKVKHRHIVALCSTYQHPDMMTLHFEPAAKFDLRSYLELVELRLMRSRVNPANPVPLVELELLIESFGCLSGALSAIHAAGYDHGDIRPENILIHDKRIFFSKISFGLKYGNYARRTNGIRRFINPFGFMDVENHGSQPTQKKVPPTLSPDESLYKPTEWKSEPSELGQPPADVFSLGCVFLEIYKVITGGRVRDFEESRVGAGIFAYRDTLPRTQELLLSFEQDQYDSKDKFVNTLLGMIHSDPAQRPTAVEVLNTMKDCYTSEGDTLKRHRRCGPCA